MLRNCDQTGKFREVNDIVCWILGRIARPFESALLIGEILDHTMKTTGCLRADLLLYQSDMNILFFSESVTSDGRGGEGRLSLADSKNSAPVEALMGGHTVLVEDVRDSGFLSFSPGSRTLLSVPVIYSARIHGVFNLEHPLPDYFGPESVRWIESVTSILAILLDQSYLTEQLFKLNQKLIDQMTSGIEEADPNFRQHAERVSVLAVEIAREMKLEASLVEAVRESGFLHDIGKTGVSKSILVKPGNLSSEEMDQIKRHPVLGRFLLKPLGFQTEVIEGVVSHHERWDGKGYPSGLVGDKIPVTGRILAVAEAYDVMTSDQPYRKKISHSEALREIKTQAGTQFDPLVVEALARVNFTET